KAVSQSYLQDMGRTAYDTLHAIMEAKRAEVFANIYAELSEKFPFFVEVLIEVSQRHAFKATESVDDLIERWSRTRNSNVGQQMLEQGMLPLWTYDPDNEH